MHISTKLLYSWLPDRTCIHVTIQFELYVPVVLHDLVLILYIYILILYALFVSQYNLVYPLYILKLPVYDSARLLYSRTAIRMYSDIIGLLSTVILTVSLYDMILLLYVLEQWNGRCIFWGNLPYSRLAKFTNSRSTFFHVHELYFKTHSADPHYINGTSQF